MPQVDFYVLPENTAQERFVCLITNKVWRKGNKVFINTASREAAETFDRLLWTYKDISFVPHEMADSDTSSDCPIIIGWQDNAPDNSEVLINLAHNIPSYADKFARIVEIVAGDNADRHQSRNKYSDYRNRGYDLNNHSIEPGYDNI